MLRAELVPEVATRRALAHGVVILQIIHIAMVLFVIVRVGEMVVMTVASAHVLVMVVMVVMTMAMMTLAIVFRLARVA